jgi:hypothetical protein
MKKGQHIKEAAVASKDAEKPPYEPTPIEAEAIAAYRAAKDTRGPRIKVSIEGDVAKINQDHPDAFTGAVAVMRAMGTTDLDFFDGLMLQLVNASKGQGPSRPCCARYRNSDAPRFGCTIRKECSAMCR